MVKGVRVRICMAALLGPLSAVGYGTAVSAELVDPLRQVPIPELQAQDGDFAGPLPAEAAYPSSDPRNFAGIWTAHGNVRSADGKPPPYRPEITAQMQRIAELEQRGTPVVSKGTLCRPGTAFALSVPAANLFPTLIVHRPEKMLIIAEEGRSIWPVYINQQHPNNLKPSRMGHNVGRWEGNTLVIDSVGFSETPPSIFSGGSSKKLHIVTRLTRANDGDKRNGDRLVVTRTIDDPAIFEHSWTEVGLMRWRSDMELLEFNCEESTPAQMSSGVKVE